MTAPRNNLDDVLRRLQPPATPSGKAKLLQTQTGTSKSKFKPALNLPRPLGSESDTAISTSVSSKTKPMTIQTMQGSLDVSVDDDLRPNPPISFRPQATASGFCKAQSSSNSGVPFYDTSIPGKRASPASSLHPPAKRSRSSLEPEKENLFEQGDTTQVAETQDQEDSGYISVIDKGKGRYIPPILPTLRTPNWPMASNPMHKHVPGPHPLSSSNVLALGTRYSGRTGDADTVVSRLFEFNCAYLLSMSPEDLQEHKNQLVDLRSQFMNMRPQLQTNLAAVQMTHLLQKFDEIIQDRLRCVDSCTTAEQSGQERHLPPTKWIITPPQHNTLPLIQSPPAVIPDVIRATATLDKSMSGHPSSGVDTPFNHESESDDELWDQIDELAYHRYEPGPVAHLRSPLLRMATPGEETTAVANQTHADLRKSPHYPELERTLRDVFGLRSFRKNQLEAIVAHMDGHDVFVLMPTGGGKSLCFQLPAVCRNIANNSVTVVIGPLLALMQDQVRYLESKGLDIVHFCQGQTAEEYNSMQARLRHKDTKPCMVFISPEKLHLSSALKRELEQLYQSNQLGGIVVDEAHCIATWGRSFRESVRFPLLPDEFELMGDEQYTKLEWLREKFKGVPFMALTATANRQTVEDIVTKLGIAGCKRIAMSFNRSNLFYEVCSKKSDRTTQSDIAHFIKTKYPSQTGIIYWNNKEKCDKLAQELRDEYHLQAASYHADLDKDTRARLQTEWQQGKIHVIVATVAFGMGIDKADVRFVIHYSIPTSLSNYYQETGRAGRDGEPSHCRLYYSYKDAKWPLKCARTDAKHQADIDHTTDNIRRVIQYSQNNVDCRRVQVLSYFDEKFDKTGCNNNCDNCRDSSDVTLEDVTATALDLVELAREASGDRVTRAMLCEIYTGKLSSGNKLKGFERYQSWAKGNTVSKDRVERVFDHLWGLGALELKTEQGHTGWGVDCVEIARNVRELLPAGSPIVLGFRHPRRKETAVPAASDGVTAVGGPSRRRNKQTVGRPTEIADDQISLFASDGETGEADPEYRSAHVAGSSAVDDYEEQIAKSCRGALEERVDLLCSQTGIDLKSLFSEEALSLLALVRPSDIAECHNQLESVDGFDYDQAAKHLPSLLSICIDHRRRLEEMRAHPAREMPPPMSQLHQQYGYKQAAPISTWVSRSR